MGVVWLCAHNFLHMNFVIFVGHEIFFFPQPFKNVKTTDSPQAPPKRAGGWSWPVDNHSSSSPALDILKYWSPCVGPPLFLQTEGPTPFSAPWNQPFLVHLKIYLLSVCADHSKYKYSVVLTLRFYYTCLYHLFGTYHVYFYFQLKNKCWSTEVIFLYLIYLCPC